MLFILFQQAPPRRHQHLLYAKEHAQLSTMHRSRTCFNAPHGKNNQNTDPYIQKLPLAFKRTEWTKGICDIWSRGRYFSLSLSACRQVSETWLTKAITGPKSRGTSFGTTLRRHAQRYCSFGILLTHAQFPQNWSSYHIRGETISAYRSNTVFISANFFNMWVKF